MEVLSAKEKKMVARITKADAGDALSISPEEYQTIFNVFCKAYVTHAVSPGMHNLNGDNWNKLYCRPEYSNALKAWGESHHDGRVNFKFKEDTVYPLLHQEGSPPEGGRMHLCAEAFGLSFPLFNPDMATTNSRSAKYPTVDLDFNSLHGTEPYTFQNILDVETDGSRNIYCVQEDCRGFRSNLLTRSMLKGVRRRYNRAFWVIKCPKCGTLFELACSRSFHPTMLHSLFSAYTHGASRCVYVRTSHNGITLSSKLAFSRRHKRYKVFSSSGSEMAEQMYLDNGMEYLFAEDMIRHTLAEGLSIYVGGSPGEAVA